MHEQGRICDEQLTFATPTLETTLGEKVMLAAHPGSSVGLMLNNMLLRPLVMAVTMSAELEAPTITLPPVPAACIAGWNKETYAHMQVVIQAGPGRLTWCCQDGADQDHLFIHSLKCRESKGGGYCMDSACQTVCLTPQHAASCCPGTQRCQNQMITAALTEKTQTKIELREELPIAFVLLAIQELAAFLWWYPPGSSSAGDHSLAGRFQQTLCSWTSTGQAHPAGCHNGKLSCLAA